MKKLSTYNDQELLIILEINPSKIMEVFNIIYKRYSSDVLSYCTYITNNSRSASDICQETWIEFDEALKNNIKITSIKNLLFFLARKFAARIANEERNSNIILTDELDNTFYASVMIEQQTLEYLHFEDTLHAMEVALSFLKPEIKDAYILRKLCDYDYESIAIRCGCSREAARQKVKRAADFVSNILAKHVKDLNLDKL